ncbi:LysR substrate-binding domain-containing protein [Pelagibacterium xiamenense]|uniref:LysR substrate-binding domain-containing protein n=1 Tax=Pelagibacterium xiamenense TaxID=2901140 RepID=UPI001E38FB8F|nr:LysR substrate-binding domain-containing protein [Pelagibacterium xiamenense]MCD7059399.1 LysR family transcriptional regulator [Pelagibacterium xiamenense]
MPRTNINDLTAFVAVARERSFTKAAVRLDVSPSALSHTIRGLEERLGLRLLSRTTRNVSPTEAGERLLRSVGPHLDEIENEVEALGALRDKPAGTIRISASDYVADTILRPRLVPLLRQHPDLTVELVIDNGFTNIVERRIDAGVRLGESLSKDMIAVRIGPDWRFAVVGTPDYFDTHPTPVTPQDLTAHRCINIRLPTAGQLYAWEFAKDGRALEVRVDGPFTSNSVLPVVGAALDGLGLAYIPHDLAEPHLASGRLVEVLADWCPYFEGYHLYYPHRRQASPAFALVVEALRYRG